MPKTSRKVACHFVVQGRFLALLCVHSSCKLPAGMHSISTQPDCFQSVMVVSPVPSTTKGPQPTKVAFGCVPFFHTTWQHNQLVKKPQSWKVPEGSRKSCRKAVSTLLEIVATILTHNLGTFKSVDGLDILVAAGCVFAEPGQSSSAGT